MTSSTFRADAVSARILRWWRCRPWSVSPLMRWPDRLLSAVRLVAAVVVVSSIPIALALGTGTYTDDAARIRADNAEAVSAEAVISDRPEFTQSQGWRAKARWEGSAGQVQDIVAVPRTASQGDRITVWLDGAGHATEAPRPPFVAVMNGIGVAVVVLVGSGLSMWFLVVLGDLFVDYRRGVGWDREWSAMRRPTQDDR
ncbi:Rv1733c family protein [Nocardia rhizosphaerihabitans]|nr:hypothetical protein [Nocardia rhizosphaerihabitans]